MKLENLDVSSEAIAELCRRHGVRELSVFGSALREDFTAESDVDFLALFEDEDYGPWMQRLNEFERALSRLLGRRAEVIPKHGLKWAIRDRVLASAERVYDATWR